MVELGAKPEPIIFTGIPAGPDVGDNWKLAPPVACES